MPGKSQCDTPRRTGVLLVGHGTRSEAGCGALLMLAERIRRRLPLPLEPCFLELAEPTIAKGVARLVRAGIDRLIIAPQLLFAAGHAKEDVPAAVEQALRDCAAAGIAVSQTSHYGCHELIVELAHHRLREAIGGRDRAPPDETLLIVVGRGSRDAEASHEMHEFARVLARRAELARHAVAFLAMARPTLDEALEAAAAASLRRIIVQPHLLFPGELTEKLSRRVAESSAARPEREWIISPVLADELEEGGKGAELLTAAAIDLIKRHLA
jgi:sirohydrochlorin cobaltochelatase